MGPQFTWTLDCEGDFGGRTNGIKGITDGLPLILEIFRANGIQALFLISTEIALDHRARIQSIIDKGHEIGSHGHFHIKFKEKWRAREDRLISEELLTVFRPGPFEYRAPWFYHDMEGSIYSKKKNHVSVLKQSWFGGRIPDNPIFYIHPFDIVEARGAPNIFTRILYSNPKRVYETFTRLAQEYPGRRRL